MEIPDLGKQCNATVCQQLDFLPIQCQYCSETFCKEHFPPQYHDCKGDYDKVITEAQGKRNYRHPCEFLNCKNGELTPVVCQGCSKNFCLQHRHQVDHGCPAYQPTVNPMAEAAQKNQQLTDRMKSATPGKGQGRKSDKLAAKVQLMKLKQKSSGQTSLPQEERLYLLVLLPKDVTTKAQPVFVSHHWTIGRAVDAVAAIAKVPNRNNITGADKLLLFHSSDGTRLGPMDKTLKSLLDDQQLFNGQSVILEYQPSDTQQLKGFKEYKS